jgi:hypothetical protein
LSSSRAISAGCAVASRAAGSAGATRTSGVTVVAEADGAGSIAIGTVAASPGYTASPTGPAALTNAAISSRASGTAVASSNGAAQNRRRGTCRKEQPAAALAAQSADAPDRTAAAGTSVCPLAAGTSGASRCAEI